MKRFALAISCALIAGGAACGILSSGVIDLPIETSFNFTNLSTRYYAMLDIRDADSNGAYYRTKLLPPGATQRERFLDTLGAGCPDAVDLRVVLYDRVNADLPIGLDDGEEVVPTPVAAGTILGVPACSVQTVETYTIVNWDAPEGEARVKIAQATLIEQALAQLDAFANTDGVWEFEGVEADLADESPSEAAENLPIEGRVALPDGSGAEGIGVLLRTRFRLRLDDTDSSNDPDAGFGAPIAVTTTDSDGSFSFERPAGAYRVEAFADDVLFRPAIVDIEAPQQTVLIIAEPD